MSASSVQSSPSLMGGISMPISMSMDYSTANGGMLRRPTMGHMSSLMAGQQAVNLVNHPAVAAQGQAMSESSFGPSSTPQWTGRDSSPLSERHRKDSMERTLNFSTSPHDDEYGYGKKKTAPREVQTRTAAKFLRRGAAPTWSKQARTSEKALQVGKIGVTADVMAGGARGGTC